MNKDQGLLFDRIEKVQEREVDVVRRRVYLTGEITWESAMQALQSIQVLDDGYNDINLYIVTEGGDSSPGMALFSGIRLCRSRVIGHAWGECSSTGAIVLQACHIRKMAKEAVIMIHPGRLTFKNRHAQDFINFADNAKRDLEVMWHLFYDRMRVGLSYDEFKNMTKNDKYFNAEEALSLGLIDDIE
jgi:ATP-dependent protease ClpP protease subunit